jgi:branched-chain amino acid transport system substrate-binding protein
VYLGAAGPWHLDYGETTRRGIEMAVEEVNEGGGIRGRPLAVLFRNDSASGVRAVALAEGFVADRRVAAVLGHVNSGAMIAAAKVYHGRMASVAPTAASPELSGISPWVFRLISNDSVFGAFLAREATRLAPRAAVLYDNNSFGRGGARAFQRTYGGRLMGVDPVEPAVSSVEPHVTWFRRERVGLVYVAGNTPTALAVLREARRQGFTGSLLGTDSWTSIVADTAMVEGTYVGMRFTPTDPRPEAAAFVRRFRARYGRDPDALAAFAYDAAHLLAASLRDAGTDRAAVRRHLAGRTEATAFPGATGRIWFQPEGEPPAQRFVLMRVRRGALVPEGPDAAR